MSLPAEAREQLTTEFVEAGWSEVDVGIVLDSFDDLYTAFKAAALVNAPTVEVSTKQMLVALTAFGGTLGVQIGVAAPE